MNFSESTKNVVDWAVERNSRVTPVSVKDLMPNRKVAVRIMQLNESIVGRDEIKRLVGGSTEPLRQMIEKLYNKMVKNKYRSVQLVLTKTTVKMLEQIIEGEKPTPVPAGLMGFVRADKIDEIKRENTFMLAGSIGTFLGGFQQYRCAIVLKGNRGSGKTSFAMQLANAFINADKTVGFFSLEQGGMESKDTQLLIERYITPENRKMMAVATEVESGKEFETVKKYASQFDVIVIDSWQKMNLKSTDFDLLRSEHPKTIWVVTFQMNAAGKTRGGNAPEFDAPIVLNTVAPNPFDFSGNYIIAEKNRGNSIEHVFFVADRRVMHFSEL